MKNKENYQIMQNFSLKNIPDLDICVLGSLEMLSEAKIPDIKIPFKKPMVVGSGNANAAGKIIFKDKDAVFANESNFEEKLSLIKSIDGVVIISASGGKHAPKIVKKSKKFNKKTVLITNNKDSISKSMADKIIVFPKQREPYTYNTSTYMSMIISKTKEDPEKIYMFIKKRIDNLKLPNFKKFNKFYIIIPGEFLEISRMVQVKFIELFGRNIARDVETIEYVKHATTIAPSNELFISIGIKNKTWGKNRLFVPLPKNPGYASIMAISYYLIGKIQKVHPPYFKRNIESYCKKISKIFNQKINPIVE